MSNERIAEFQLKIMAEYGAEQCASDPLIIAVLELLEAGTSYPAPASKEGA